MCMFNDFDILMCVYVCLRAHPVLQRWITYSGEGQLAVGKFSLVLRIYLVLI